MQLDAQRAECQVLSFGAQFFLAQRAECQGLSLLALPVQENKKNWHCAQRAGARGGGREGGRKGGGGEGEGGGGEGEGGGGEGGGGGRGGVAGGRSGGGASGLVAIEQKSLNRAVMAAVSEAV